MLIYGVGYVLKNENWPLEAFILGIVANGLVEKERRRHPPPMDARSGSGSEPENHVDQVLESEKSSQSGVEGRCKVTKAISLQNGVGGASLHPRGESLLLECAGKDATSVIA